ncbi:MAG: phosphatase PAP2 family protein [Solobacterium sp.]|nr:phosphatase PAP2 family protein [Solobacterium sp.]MBR2770036.1 phosphatase PAP2 family protein [Solobacterium sp.]
MKKKYTWALGVAAVWIVFVILLKVVDVKAIGPEGTSVGFAAINGAVHDMLGFNEIFYTISKILGYIVILAGACFGVTGVLHIFKKRHLNKADPAVLATFALYFMFAVIYLFFEIVIINYRPMIMPGDEHVEASFPSSHSMLAVIIMGSYYLLTQRYVTNLKTRKILRIVCAVLMVGTILTRFLSGVHWLTDILGGVWIGIALIIAYDGALDDCDAYRKKKKRKKKAAPAEAAA